VIDGGKGVLAFGVEAKEDVVFVRGAEEVSGEVELAFGQIRLGLEGLKCLFVFECENDDGRSDVGGGVGHERVKDGTHLLKLAGDAARLLFVGVGEDNEVWTCDFEPVFIGLGCQGSKSDAEEKQGRNVLVHSYPRVNEGCAGWKRNCRLPTSSPEGASAGLRLRGGYAFDDDTFGFEVGDAMVGAVTHVDRLLEKGDERSGGFGKPAVVGLIPVDGEVVGGIALWAGERCFEPALERGEG
jgi:hypothetical protein